MKGILHKTEQGWIVIYDQILGEGIVKKNQNSLPLNPYDVQTIEDQEKVFDNIEARISAYPDVEFEIELFWETGIEEPFNVATLVKNENDWDVTLNDGLEGL